MKHSDDNVVERRAAWLLLYLLVVALMPNVVLCFTEGMAWQADAANVLLPAGLYMLAATLSPRVGRAVWWFFPVLFFGAFEIVLLYLFGSSIIAVDMFLNLVTSNATEMMELLSDMWIIVLFVFAVYLPLLIWGGVAIAHHYKVADRLRRRVRLAGLPIFLLGFIAMGLAWMAGPSAAIEDAQRYNPFTQLFPLNAADNAVMAFERGLRSSRYHLTSASWAPEVTATHANDSVPELYILVVGETTRGAQWQLAGYHRPTNPRLSQRQGLHYFPYAMSESATTHKSVPMLLSSVASETFDSIWHRRGLIDMFNRAGFDTWFISNQQRNGSLIDFLAQEADTAIFVKDNASMLGNYYDMDMLPAIGQKVNGPSKRQLMVVHTYGSHFKYCDRYPEQYRRFTPDGPLFTNASCRDNLVNAYDNTVVYIDALLDSIVGMAENSGKRAAVMYISDHGEDIFDDPRERFLHSSPVPTAYQLHVPMFVWLSSSYVQAWPAVAEAVDAATSRQVSTSKSVYPTMLDLAGIASPQAEQQWSVARPGYADVDHLFLTDHNNAVSLKSAGFKPFDFDYMKAHGLH